MKTFCRTALALLLCIVTLPAAAQTSVFNQPAVFPGSSNFSAWTSDHDSSTSNRGDLYVTSDNFTPSGSADISNLTWQGFVYTDGTNQATFATPRSFTLTFRADASGVPGAILSSSTVSSYMSTTAGTVNYFGNGSIETIVNYSAALPMGSAFSATAGIKYWVSVVANCDYPTVWAWAQGTGGNNASFQQAGGVRAGDRALSLSGTLHPALDWKAFRIAAFADGSARVLWTNASGAVLVQAVAANGQVSMSAVLGPYSGLTAQGFAAAPDGTARLLWANSNGTAAVWTLNASGAVISTGQTLQPAASITPRAVAVGTDGLTRVLWNRSDGAAFTWTLAANGSLASTSALFGPYAGWSATGLSSAPANALRLLWTNTDGRASFWSVPASGPVSYSAAYGPYSGWSVQGIAVGADTATRLLWTNTDGHMSVWTVRPNGGIQYSTAYGPYSGWTAGALAVGSDNAAQVLWANVNGTGSFWRIGTSGVTYSPTLGPFNF